MYENAKSRAQSAACRGRTTWESGWPLGGFSRMLEWAESFWKLAPRIPSLSVSPHHRSGMATKTFIVQRAVQQKPHKHTDSFLPREKREEATTEEKSRKYDNVPLVFEREKLNGKRGQIGGIWAAVQDHPAAWQQRELHLFICYADKVKSRELLNKRMSHFTGVANQINPACGMQLLWSKLHCVSHSKQCTLKNLLGIREVFICLPFYHFLPLFISSAPLLPLRAPGFLMFQSWKVDC